MKKQFKIIISFTVFGLALLIWSFGIEPSLLIQKDIKIPRWQGPNLRIAFFSDLHAGAPHINEHYIKNLILRINALAPDLILIGGDLVINGVVGGKYMPIEQVASMLKELKAPLGCYAVLGNHDWWNNGDKIKEALQKNGINVLDNNSKLIPVVPNFNFWLVGIGDEFTGHANVDFAFSQINSELDAPKILFMHDPAALFQVKSKFFLTLAGHMHGGQVFIPGIGAIITPGKAPRDWAGGWIDFELGSLFVSKGIGTSILPVRFNAPPEFVILDLKN
jgi:predicted MPP superfamily phosphohydrolase